MDTVKNEMEDYRVKETLSSLHCHRKWRSVSKDSYNDDKRMMDS